MVSVGHMPKYAAWGRAYLIAPNATRVLHIEKYHNANQPFGGCLVPDWDLSVKKGKKMRKGSSHYIHVISVHRLAETTQFRPAK
jgi:hypothetical protein